MNIKFTRGAIAAILFFAATMTPKVWAQDQGWAKVEASIGYTYANIDQNVGLGSGKRLSSNGINLGGTIGINKWLAAELNTASVTHSESLSIFNAPLPSVTGTTSQDNNTYTFGPRFVLDRGKVRPYAHALVGVDHQDLSFSASALGASVSQHITDNALAALVGGGVELAVSKHVALTAEGDYLLTRHGSPAILSTVLGVPSTTATQNNFRSSVGIVFRFGSGFEKNAYGPGDHSAAVSERSHSM